VIRTLQESWRRNAARLTRRDRVLDAVLALLLFGASVLILYSHGLGEPQPDTRDGDALGVALLALACIPLAYRRFAPSLVLAVCGAAVIPVVALRYPGEITNLPLIAVYTLAAAGESDPLYGRAAKALVGVLFAGLALAVIFAYDGDTPEIVVEGALWVAVWIAGDRTRLRRERIVALEERVQRAEREVERERRLAAAEERTQIARELHDSAGHAMNVILVEAGAARLLRDRDPPRARAALETIEQVARSTIGEIDRLVRHLRDPRDARATATPLPGLGDVEELAERQRASGLQVTTRTEGPARTLPADVDRAAYRIIQEGLTNAAKHGRDGAEVEILFGARNLEVRVTNPIGSNGSGDGRGGHGIIGMRERVSLLGGRLDAESGNGLFRIRALLPYESDAE
jgi:signal transduction histidine kinase